MRPWNSHKSLHSGLSDSLYLLTREAVSQFDKTVISRRRRRDLRPGEQNDVKQDPWFDKLTTLSEVEGESRELAENQIILDLPPTPAGDDEFRHGLRWEGN